MEGSERREKSKIIQVSESGNRVGTPPIKNISLEH